MFDTDKKHIAGLWKVLFISLIYVVFMIPLSHAANFDLTLQWDENTEPDLATGTNPRYKIYYKTGTSGSGIKNNFTGLPAGDAAADEGSTPVGVIVSKDENPDPLLVQFTLHNLDDTLAYYLAVTALDNLGNESDLSNEVFLLPDLPPTLAITGPTSESTYTTTSATMNLGGTATDDKGISSVTWTNSRGGSGNAAIASGNWSVTGIALLSGSNIITVTATDTAGKTATDTLTVTYNVPDLAPTVAITSPTSAATYTTTTATMNLGGTAADDKGISSVTWTNSRGGSGNAAFASGNWSVTGTALLSGSNIITVTATDTSGKTATDTLTVTYNIDTAPVVTITSPTSDTDYQATSSLLNLGGTAVDDIGISSLTWSNSRGGNGVGVYSAGTWSVSGVYLKQGDNLLTITVKDTINQTSTKTLSVTYKIKPPGNIKIATDR